MERWTSGKSQGNNNNQANTGAYTMNTTSVCQCVWVCICVSDGCCFCLSVSCTRLGFEIGISTSAIPRIIVYRKCSLRIHGEKKKKNNPSRREKLARFFRGLVRKIYVFSAVHRFARNANLSSFIPLIKSPFSTPVSVSLPLSLAHMSGQMNYAPFFS